VLWHTATMLSVILLPGLACDAGLWRHQLPALATRAHVHVSDVHQREDSLPAMAARLAAELPPGPHVVIGASMGAMLAMHLALAAPEQVQALALLGTSARADTPELIRLRTDACELFAQGRMDEVLRANVMFAFHPEQARDPVLVNDYLEMIRRAGATQLIRQNRAVMARADLRDALPRITCPALVAVGDADQLTPPDAGREIAARLPRARFELVPGAGHMLTLEQPGRVSALLLDWLGKLAAPTPEPTPVR
jgi:pimeloyl-ACP methyl ester carboxylesterase